MHACNFTEIAITSVNLLFMLLKTVFQLNEAGRRYVRLVKEDWSTHVNRSLTSGSHFDLRGFRGDYEVVIRQNGAVVKTATFSLNGSETTVDISVGTSNSQGICAGLFFHNLLFFNLIK
jgi:hypothetical protein